MNTLNLGSIERRYLVSDFIGVVIELVNAYNYMLQRSFSQGFTILL